MRDIIGGVAAALVGLICAAPAFAKIPQIGGNYVSTTRVFCQPSLNITHAGGAVNSVTLGQAGPTATSVTLEYWDPHTGVVTISGVGESGSPVLLQDDISGLSGDPTAESPISQSFPFSNSATTVTIGAITYHAEWGLRKKDVPEYFALLYLDGNGCVTQSEKVRR